MKDNPYSNRELDSKFNQVHEKLDIMSESQKENFKKIIIQMMYTNEKVKRIILILTAVTAFSIGIGILDAKAILTLFF